MRHCHCIAILSLALPLAAACSLETRGQDDAPEPGPGPAPDPDPAPQPEPDPCDPNGIDFDADGLALGCDALIALPDPFDRGALENHPLQLAAAADTAVVAVSNNCLQVALPPDEVADCPSVAPVVIAGNAHAASHPEIVDTESTMDLRATVTGDGVAWLARMHRTLTDDLWMVHAGRASQIEGLESNYRLFGTETGAWIQCGNTPGGVSLEHYREGRAGIREADLDRSQLLTQHSPLTFKLTSTARERIAVDRDGRFETLLDSQAISRAAVEDPRGGAWWCGEQNAQHSLHRVHEGSVVERRRISALQAESCQDIDYVADAYGGLWITSGVAFGSRDSGTLWHWPDGADRPERLLRDFKFRPDVYRGPEGSMYLRGMFSGPPQPTSLLFLKEDRIDTLLADFPVPPLILSHGDRLGLVYRFPHPPGSGEPVFIHAGTAHGDEANAVRLPLPDTTWPHVYGTWLGPDGTLWLNIRDRGSATPNARQSLYRVRRDGTVDTAPIGDTASPSLSWNGDHGLLAEGKPGGGLWHLRGTSMSRIGNANSHHALLLNRGSRRDPHGGIDAEGRQWIAWEETPGSFTIAYYRGAGITRVLSGAEDWPNVRFEADGTAWLRFPYQGAWAAGRIDDDGWKLVHEGADEVQFVFSQRMAGEQWPRDVNLAAVALRRDGELRACPVSGSACVPAPGPAAQFVVEPRITSAGRLFAIVEDAEGGRYLWRPRRTFD